MILKFFEIEKANLELHKFLLFYGKNEGLKNEIIKKLISNRENILIYDEKEILDNQDIFYENTLSNSLFEKHKTIIIKRSTDKIFKIIEKLITKDVSDILIILNSDNLEKKSKLRSFFEKNKKLVCVPFYPDNDQVLSKLTFDFLRNKNITISSEIINLITNKCNGDREVLMNELHKIELFCKNGKRIDSKNLSKLINLNENHSISELIDNCLAQNKKKTINILNENNFSNDDCIMIIRSFVIKAKKLLVLSMAFETNKNMDLIISSAKPPIFWKEREIIKQQIYKWKPSNIKQLIYALSSTELQIKKNINNSINLITDFILLQSSSATNN
jgi:DNA polymerase-3 subunit delta